MLSSGFFFLENIKEFDDSDAEKDAQRKMNLYISPARQLLYSRAQVKSAKTAFSSKTKYENFPSSFPFLKRRGTRGILHSYLVHNGKEMYRDL